MSEPDLGQITFARGAVTDLGDWGAIYDAARQDILTTRTQIGEAFANEDAADRRNEAIFKATGIRLDNPLRVKDDAGDYVSPVKQIFRWEQRLSELAEQFPDKRDVIRPDETLAQSAGALAREREALHGDLLSRYRGPWGTGTAASFAGGFVGSMQDPPNAVMNIVSMGLNTGRNLLRSALLNGAANAAIEAGQAPWVQDWRRRAGLDHGLLEAGKDVGMAFASGAILDAGLRGTARGISFGTARARGLDVSARDVILEGRSPRELLAEAAEGAPAGDPVRRAMTEGDDQALFDLARKADLTAPERGALNEVERHILFGAPPAVDRGEHLTRLADAIERSMNPEAPPPGDAISLPPIKGPDLSDAAPTPNVGSVDRIEGKPVSYQRFTPRDLEIDAGRVELDPHADPIIRGSTWDPVAAGKAVIFEGLDGRKTVVDGHRRLDLARRLEGQGQKPELQGYLFREADGWRIEDARAHAAIKNLREMSKSPLDMALVMRARPDLVTGDLPLSSYKLKQAVALSRLSEGAFAMVASGRVKANHAVVVGDLVPDRGRHVGLLTEIAKADVSSVQQARLLVGQLLAGPSPADALRATLSGGTEARAGLGARVDVLDRALKHLKSDKRLFGLLEREAERIEAVGNILDREANVARAELAQNLVGLIERMAGGDNYIADALDDAARAVEAGIKVRTAAEAFARRIGDILERDGVDGLIRREAAARDLAPRRIDDPFGPEAKAETERLARELKEGDDELAALAPDQLADLKQRAAFDEAVRAGRVAEVSRPVVERGRSILGGWQHLVPQGYRAGVLERVEPLGNGKVRAVFAKPDGGSFDIVGPWNYFRSRRASVVDSLRAVLFFRFDAVRNFDHSLAGELTHELVVHGHLAQVLDRFRWGALVGHAEKLRVLEMKWNDFAEGIGRSDLVVDAERNITVREYYEEQYSTRPNRDRLMQEEAVAHMMELAHHGHISAAELAPVAPILKRALGQSYPAVVGGGEAAAFAGPAARSANTKLLSEAERMEKGGATAFETWLATGWHRGTDGKWRWEINDREARLKARPAPGKGVSGRLEDLLDHPLLFEAYPHLRGFKLDLVRAEEVKASIDIARRHIRVEAPSTESALRKVMHEAQHAIQRKERFAEGGSPEAAIALKRQLVDGIDAEAADLLARIEAAETSRSGLADLLGLPDDRPGMWSRVEALRAERDALENEAIKDFVHRLAGEVEARNVERRLAWERGERKASSPAKTEDVARADQVTAFDMPGRQMSDDWENETWAQATRRAFAIELHTYERQGGRGRAVDRTALERKAEALAKQVRDVERKMIAEGKTAGEIAAEISSRFRIDVDPAALAKGMAWWRLTESAGPGRITPEERTFLSEMRLSGASFEKMAAELKTRFGREIKPHTIASNPEAYLIGYVPQSKRPRVAPVKETSGYFIKPEERALLTRMRAGGASNAEMVKAIKEQFGRDITAKALTSRPEAYFNDYSRRPRLPWTPEHVETLQQMAMEGKSGVQMAEHFSKIFGEPVNGRQVFQALKRFSARKADDPAAHTGAWPPDVIALLTSDEVDGMSYSQIARLLTERTGNVYSRASIGGKLARLRDAEMMSDRQKHRADLVETCKK